MKRNIFLIVLIAFASHIRAAGIEGHSVDGLRLVCKGTESIDDQLLSKMLGYKTRSSTVKIEFFARDGEMYALIDGFSARLFIKRDGALGLAPQVSVSQLAEMINHSSNVQESDDAVHMSNSFRLRLDRETGRLELEDAEITTDKRNWSVVSSKVTGVYACERSQGLKF